MWYTWDYQYNLGHCLPMCLLSVDLKTKVLPYFALARSKCRGGRTLQHSQCSHFHHVVLSACACAHLPWCTWHTRARSSYRYHLYTYCISQCINFYRYNYHIITYHYWVGTTITLGTASLISTVCWLDVTRHHHTWRNLPGLPPSLCICILKWSNIAGGGEGLGARLLNITLSLFSSSSPHS